MKNVLFLSLISFLLTFQTHADIDWPHVIETMSLAPEKYQTTPVLGGASNINYQLIYDSSQYFVRFAPKTGESLYADLGIEFEVLNSIHKLGISAKPCYYNPEKGVLVTDFIPHNKEKIDLLNPETRQKIFELLHKIENSGVEISRTFRPYQDVMSLVATARSAGCDSFPEEFYRLLLPSLEQIDAILATNQKKSLCHLDLHSNNVVNNHDRYWIIDWEYATMSHPFLVLASMASIENWDDQQMQTLLDDYMEHSSQEEYYQLYLYRIVSDIFWTVWNHVQDHCSSIDNPYSDWEKVYYEAAVNRLNSQQYLKAIAFLTKVNVCAD